ncbi:hypothetical protein FFV08_02555 [Streptococcus sanguinis]|uniref:Uncharacterized protein n=1 Tax=Streptococcus sanguinis TaxID=1305 RepID=A0A7H8VAM3_STRSA|nr:hypothetical protein FFV08_02555 [Streptococcus sanguinis]
MKKIRDKLRENQKQSFKECHLGFFVIFLARNETI